MHTYYLGFDWSGWIVLIKSEILIMMGNSDKWKGPRISGAPASFLRALVGLITFFFRLYLRNQSATCSDTIL